MAAVPSLELVAEAVQAERDKQLRHFDGLDTKAGVVLGFAGILVALGRNTDYYRVVVEAAAVLAALCALSAFLPRGYPVLSLAKMRDRYLHADPRFTGLHLLDTYILAVEETSSALARKARWLRAATGLLASAVVLVFLEALLG